MRIVFVYHLNWPFTTHLRIICISPTVAFLLRFGVFDVQRRNVLIGQAHQARFNLLKRAFTAVSDAPLELNNLYIDLQVLSRHLRWSIHWACTYVDCRQRQ